MGIALDEVPDPLLAVTGPAQVHPRVLRALMRIVDHRSPHFHALYKDVVEGLRKVFDTGGDVFVLTASGTGAVEAMVMNFVRPRDKVVVPSYGSFSRRLINHLRRIGAEVVEIKYEVGKVPTLEDLRARVEAMGIKEFDALAAVYNETNPGSAFRDLPRVARWARSMGALVLVDNVSALGGDYFSMDKWGIDVAASASQKCLASPPVISFVAVSTEEALRKMEAVEPPSIYFDLKLAKKFAERLETPFTPAVNYLFALREALSIIMDVGLEDWIRWHVERGIAIFKALTALGLRPVVNEDARSTTVLTFDYPEGTEAEKFRGTLYKLGVSVSDAMDELRGRAFRIGNMGFLTKRDSLALVSAIASAMATLGHGTGDIGRALIEVSSYWEPRKLSIDDLW